MIYNKTRVESDQPDKRFLVEKFFGRKYFRINPKGYGGVIDLKPPPIK